MLSKIGQAIIDENAFYSAVDDLAVYLGYETRTDHIKKLYQTITDEKFHVAFEAEKYQHIAITFHSSKGIRI